MHTNVRMISSAVSKYFNFLRWRKFIFSKSVFFSSYCHADIYSRKATVYIYKYIYFFYKGNVMKKKQHSDIVVVACCVFHVCFWRAFVIQVSTTYQGVSIKVCFCLRLYVVYFCCYNTMQKTAMQTCK